jgi:CheY-like chemotaxis protein/two-component sensor histidine kinase
LAGGLAHDFNNLLTAILGNLSLAADKLPADSPILPIIKKSEQAATRAGDLTHKLLTFSKGDAPIKETSSLPELIRESADFVLHGSGVQCLYNIPEDLWQADIDRSQISQVIQNLALNARQAMNDSGTLSISCRNRTEKELPEEAQLLPPDNYVVITIHDDGPGIPEDIINRIFDPYFSTRKTDKTKGNGLGLAIVHSILEKHNGLIAVKSSPGQGSRFALYLPAVLKKEKNCIEKIADKTAPARMKTIMVMDDEAMIRDVARGMLQHFGHKVIVVQDGREAIATWQQLATTGHPVDAVLMDLTIPGGLGGKETIGKLLALDPDARVIVTSGYADDPIMANYAQYGFTAAISKPFTLDRLESILQSLFS